MVSTKNDGETAMISWAFIFEAPETNPQVDRMVIERGGMRTTIVGVPEPSVLPQVAAQLVAEGVQLIELCGSIEPIWVGKIAEVTGGTIPLGTVGYAGGETIARLAEIFSRPVEQAQSAALDAWEARSSHDSSRSSGLRAGG